MNAPKVGIGVLIFNNQQILLGQRHNKHGAYTWAPPGGHLEFGESFEECAIREVQEETGLILTNPILFSLTNDIFLDENKHYISIFLWSIYPIAQQIENLEPDKTLSWEWFSINQLPNNLFLPLTNLLKIKAKELELLSLQTMRIDT